MKTHPLHTQHARAVENLVFEWARAIDEDRVEAIADLLTPQGRYTVTSRFNHDRGLPMAIIDCHNAAQLRDRIKSLRIANIYEPHHYRHLVSGVQVIGSVDQEGTVDQHGADGAKPVVLDVRSNFTVIRTMALDGNVKVFATGQCQDQVHIEGDDLHFVRRTFVYDSRVVETLMVIPL
jgi:anthranilate 1,2-dioxygenase small subunit